VEEKEGKVKKTIQSNKRHPDFSHVFCFSKASWCVGRFVCQRDSCRLISASDLSDDRHEKGGEVQFLLLSIHTNTCVFNSLLFFFALWSA